jgi:hypothetical protein
MSTGYSGWLHLYMRFSTGWSQPETVFRRGLSQCRGVLAGWHAYTVCLNKHRDFFALSPVCLVMLDLGASHTLSCGVPQCRKDLGPSSGSAVTDEQHLSPWGAVIGAVVRQLLLPMLEALHYSAAAAGLLGSTRLNARHGPRAWGQDVTSTPVVCRQGPDQTWPQSGWRLTTACWRSLSAAPTHQWSYTTAPACHKGYMEPRV